MNYPLAAALAGFTTLITGTAVAQSNVTVYGMVDAGFAYERNSRTGDSVRAIQSGMLSSSRLGFRGSEDLGNGLKALWVIETGILIDTGKPQHPDNLWGRQSLVGLSGSFGTVSLGRQYAPEDGVNARFDPFEHGMAGNAGNLMKAIAIRANNSVKYVSPTVAGFTGTLVYGFGEVAGNHDAGRYLSGALEYGSGPFAAGLSFEQMRNLADTATGRKYQLGGSYDFGAAKLYAMVQSDRDVDGAIPTRGAKSTQYLLGLSAPVGTSGKALVSYIRENDRDTADKDAAMWAVGYIHALSKRTDLYAAYAHLDNRNGANFSLGNGQNAALVAGADRAVNMGIRHKF